METKGQTLSGSDFSFKWEPVFSYVGGTILLCGSIFLFCRSRSLFLCRRNSSLMWELIFSYLGANFLLCGSNFSYVGATILLCGSSFSYVGATLLARDFFLTPDASLYTT